MLCPNNRWVRSYRRLEGPVPTVPHVKEDPEFASKEDDQKHVLRPAMAKSLVHRPIRIGIGVHMCLRISPCI
jgi:hypothetical protein